MANRLKLVVQEKRSRGWKWNCSGTDAITTALFRPGLGKTISIRALYSQSSRVGVFILKFPHGIRSNKKEHGTMENKRRS